MKYLNLNLELFEYKKDYQAEQFRVRVANSPAGEQRLSDAETVTLRAGLRERLRSLQKRLLTLEEIIIVGEYLGAALFPPRVRRMLEFSRDSLANDEGLRIRLVLDTYALADIPWEFVYLSNADTPPDQKGPEGFLVLDRGISLVRYQSLEQPIGKLEPVSTDTLRLVALLSSPANTFKLDLDQERQNIEEALQDVPAIKAEFYANATIDELHEQIIKGMHIFHFSGHGKFEGDMGSSYGTQEGQGFLSLTGKNGEEVAFSAQKLALSLAGRGVRFAMLSASESTKVDQINAWTGVASALTRAGMPSVVGMQFSIRDQNAITFNKSFYRALGNGQTVDEAVSKGRIAIYARSQNNDPDWGVPVLYLRAAEGVLFPKRAEATVEPSRTPAVDQPLSTAPAGTSPIAQVDLRTLREAIVQFFSLEEIEILCFDVQEGLRNDGITLAVNLEMVGGEGKPAKVNNLIQYLERRKRLHYLVNEVRRSRPDII